MNEIAWPKLMRLGYLELRLAPDVFWNLTPAELMLLTGLSATPSALSRAGFEALSVKFPD